MSIWRRVYRRYKAGGLRAVSAALRRRYRGAGNWMTSPLLWTRLGGLSLALARFLPLQRPALVILSLPRSGSNWVADVLGRAPNAACLREPLTASRLEAGLVGGIVATEGARLPDSYHSAGRKVTLGLPHFPPERHVVLDPDQWAYARRRQRRLVVKEINPYLAQWFISALAPRIVYLLRHPAAVALSFQERGWWPAQNPWHSLGRHFGRAQAAAWNALQGYGQVRFVDYDALCAKPESIFRELYAFAGLTWSESVAERLRQQTTRTDSQPYGVHRVSRNQVRAWVGKIAPDDLAALKAGYTEYPHPWHQAEADWPVHP